ncbi:uncharacterized protein VTP21DRAFT_7480 [Calcarisporiella thermophila]|uniref:uncharacterized protein n=1 Tax=Calcarisporiella thermophila TaxID=911321 RepID=UPI003742F332
MVKKEPISSPFPSRHPLYEPPEQRSSSPFRNRSKSIPYIAQPKWYQQPLAMMDAKSWEPTLERSIKAIVTIKACHVRSFDTETSGAYSASGFIVDARRGIILSNRHVVSPAPIVAQGILTNYEEVDLRPIYRDPVHDFGFLQFDPRKVRFMELSEIPLSPERAKVGMEIRVVGNDAGEKLSILAGTIARLDRRAPEYGVGEYNDFNTFYLQAASGTSGGSSGSPVLDIDGHAVALNAGGASRAASSYYLPLDRVKRALNYIRRGHQVPRGTLQTEFEYMSYDELRKLGLRAEVEEEVRARFPDENGLLVVRSLLPRGPADNVLVPGDIIVKLQGEMIANFNQLFAVVDNMVGEEIEFMVCRGKSLLNVRLRVQDLHSITPDRFVEVGGGIVHELSYQIARTYQLPVGGPYVATSGHMLASASAWRKSVIVSVNSIPTPNLDAFIEAIKTLPDGARVPIRFFSLSKTYKEKVMIMHVDRHWHSFRVAVRDDTTGLWHFTEMPPPPKVHSYVSATASFPTLDESLHPAGLLMPSFVAIDFQLPYLVDGMKNTQFYGFGVIVSTDPPLIVCDRDTVTILVGDIFITVANSIIIPARLLYLHPVYNIAVLTFDRSLLGDTPIRAVEFSDKMLAQGDETWLVGCSSDYSPVVRRTVVSSISNVGTRECSPPRWRAMNVEGIKVDDAESAQGGVLCDRDGKVQALWLSYSTQNEKGRDMSFMSGLAVNLLKSTLEPMMRGEEPKLRGLGVELWTMRIAAARTLGLTDEWVRRIESSQRGRHSLLYVLNVLDQTAQKVLQVGDVILEMNGECVGRMSDLKRIEHLEEVEMVVLRDAKELRIRVPTIPLSGLETTRIVEWQGALVQMPYQAVLEQVKRVPTGVYVSCTLYGSPASVSMRPGVWVVEVGGRSVHDLDSFLEAVRAHEQELREEEDEDEEGYVRIKTVSRNDVTKVVAMKLDTHYWDTWILSRDESTISGWKYEAA